VDKGHRGPGSQTLLSPGEMKVLVMVSGKGHIEDGKGSAVRFKEGVTLLIPAVYQGAVKFEEDTEYLTVTV
jgi:hypothetical protein